MSKPSWSPDPSWTALPRLGDLILFSGGDYIGLVVSLSRNSTAETAVKMFMVLVSACGHDDTDLEVQLMSDKFMRRYSTFVRSAKSVC